jgi:hypothetical protein
MSDLVGVSLIFFLGVMGFFCFFYISNATNEVGLQIVTGVTNGEPMPMSVRKQWLYTNYVPYAAGAVSVGVFLALAQMQMAAHVNDPDTKLLAYLAALVAATGAVSWLVDGISSTLHYRSLLRQAEAD